jgi:hypothetical protein
VTDRFQQEAGIIVGSHLNDREPGFWKPRHQVSQPLPTRTAVVRGSYREGTLDRPKLLERDPACGFGRQQSKQDLLLDQSLQIFGDLIEDKSEIVAVGTCLERPPVCAACVRPILEFHANQFLVWPQGQEVEFVAQGIAWWRRSPKARILRLELLPYCEQSRPVWPKQSLLSGSAFEGDACRE